MATPADLDNPGAPEPLSAPDYVVIALAALHIVLVVASMTLVFLNRNWPPFKTRMLGMIVAQQIGGFMWILSFFVGGEYFPQLSGAGDFVNCSLPSMLINVGGVVVVSGLNVKSYRMYQVFVRKNAHMYSQWLQFFLLLSIGAALVITEQFATEPSRYVPSQQACTTTETLVPVLPMILVYSSVLLIAKLTFVFRLRRVRAQYNDFRITLTEGLAAAATSVLYSLYSVFTSVTWTRRLELLNTVLYIGLVYYANIGEQILRFLMRDQEYEESYTFGLASAPNPEDMDRSLTHQLKVGQLREKIREFASSRQMEENLDFYEAVTERGNYEDYFELEAKSMYIIDTFLRPGAPKEINISDAAKSKVLASPNITKWDVFLEARNEVVSLLETSVRSEFEKSDEYRNLKLESERQRAENDALLAAGLIPASVENIVPSSRSGGSFARPSSHLVRGKKPAHAKSPVMDSPRDPARGSMSPTSSPRTTGDMNSGEHSRGSGSKENSHDKKRSMSSGNMRRSGSSSEKRKRRRSSNLDPAATSAPAPAPSQPSLVPDAGDAAAMQTDSKPDSSQSDSVPLIADHRAAPPSDEDMDASTGAGVPLLKLEPDASNEAGQDEAADHEDAKPADEQDA